MSKTIFYLKDCDNAEFINADETEVICWIFRWSGHAGRQIAYSTDLHNLIENHYYEN